ncbi:MAG TPA: hypothetical protein VFB14_26180 [Bryobacteraceae bacterium]|jgi:hypothetical protein|nr:hypothetical protein [Bryobacteraceae bacterium]
MRPADEQKEFLEHAQFGEGKQSLTHTKVDRLFWIGLLFLVAAGAILGSAVVFKIGRDDGGPLFMMGFIAAGAVGTVLCICGLVRMQSKS